MKTWQNSRLKIGFVILGSLLMWATNSHGAWVWDKAIIPNYAIDRNFAKGEGFYENSVQKNIFDDNNEAGTTLGSMGLCAAFPIGTLAGNYALGPCASMSLSGVDALISGILNSTPMANLISGLQIPNAIVTISNYTSVYVGPEYYLFRNSTSDPVKPWGEVWGLVLKAPLTWSDVHSGESTGPQLGSILTGDKKLDLI